MFAVEHAPPPRAPQAPQAPQAERGAASVELALVAPVLLLLVFGLIQYGIYFSAMQGGSDAARDGARRAAAGLPSGCDDFRAEVRTNIDRVETGGVLITRDFSDANGNSKVDVGEDVTVTVEFQSYDLQVPFVPFIDDGIVRQAATARVEYLPVSTIGDCL